ncbi:hypothetical protein AB0I49_07850 [Streptomyces sp. NPDC050617]|uniref:hypothetical protein n=1 Tax=Streptomyces sp. NPDC050617 TaxID=3154628 RepID=UPI0034418EB5
MMPADPTPDGTTPGAGPPRPFQRGPLARRFARWAVALSPRRKWALFGSWFALDGLVALAPPVYWAAGDPALQGGIPLSFWYFIAIGAHVSAGVIALYCVEAARGEID